MPRSWPSAGRRAAGGRGRRGGDEEGRRFFRRRCRAPGVQVVTRVGGDGAAGVPSRKGPRGAGEGRVRRSRGAPTPHGKGPWRCIESGGIATKLHIAWRYHHSRCAGVPVMFAVSDSRGVGASGGAREPHPRGGASRPGHRRIRPAARPDRPERSGGSLERPDYRREPSQCAAVVRPEPDSVSGAPLSARQGHLWSDLSRWVVQTESVGVSGPGEGVRSASTLSISPPSRLAIGMFGMSCRRTAFWSGRDRTWRPP